METWLWVHRVTYRALADAIGNEWDYRDVWALARGTMATEQEKTLIVKAIHGLGHNCLPGDLW